MGVYGELKNETPEKTDERIRSLLEGLVCLEVKGGQLTQEQADLADDIAHEALGMLARRSMGESMLALSAVARLAAQVIVGPSADINGARCGEGMLSLLISGHVVTLMAEKHLETAEVMPNDENS